MRIDLVEIGEHCLDRGAEAIDVEPVKPRLAIRVGDRGIDLLQSVEELSDLTIAPHPGWEAGKHRFRQHRPGQTAHIGVVHRGIGPVGFDPHDIEAMAVDQHLGDARPRLIELGGAMRGLAEKHDSAIAEALDEIAKLMHIAKRLRRFSHQPAYAVVDGERPLCREQEPGGEAGRLGINLRLGDPLGLRLGPALLADQRHEDHGAKILLLEAVLARTAHADQRLKAERPNGNDQPAADRKLPLQRFGNLRGAGRDYDGLKWSLLWQALGAIRNDDLGIGVAESLQPGAGEFRQLFMALDGKHLVGHAADHRRRVS